MLDLGELEDLYYAACAKLKELLQGVDILLTNGFRGVRDTYFAYNNEPLRSLGPISIGAFKHSLLIHESILYSSELRSLLNRGVLEKNSRVTKNTRHHNLSPQQDAHRGNLEGTEKYINIPNLGFEHLLGWRAEVEGLQDKSNMGCGMVFGELAEKYRPMAMSAELEGSTIDRNPTPEAPQAFQEKFLTGEYISPYNLNERAKKLNVPGGPEMPCICDPECICAPLCASDLTQNCMCEENGLFVRVTEGMDIDDLDVPDLVRGKRQPSEVSESSAASLNSIDGPPSQWPILSVAYVNTGTSSIVQNRAMYENEKQIRKQKAQSSDSVTVPGPIYTTGSPLNDVPMSNTLDLSEEIDGTFWQDRLSMPPLRMSDFTQDELKQPFSKQCDHPPRRQSVTERLFKTKISNMAAHKKHSAIDQSTQGHNINGSTSKVVKQPKKRSLADISFTGLRFTRRQDSHGRRT